MSFSMPEFHFSLEMIIANRNEDGATISDIQEDYKNTFGRTFDSIYGNDWFGYLRNLLSHTLDNIVPRQAPGGYTLYFVREAELLRKIQDLRSNPNMMAILHKLNIDPNNIKLRRAPVVQNSFNSTGSLRASAPAFRPAPPKLAEFYNHTLIGDNFFLELSHIDLQMQKKKKNNVEHIGLCFSGQTMKGANGILSSPYRFSTENVIVNIGTFDLLNGRSVEQMIADICRLLNGFKTRQLKPILTTLAPLPNHLDNQIEQNRKAFNKFIREEFPFIDVESCFLSNGGSRVLRECYQEKPRAVSGSNHPVTLWNRVGRQRVVQLMKREIPNFHPLF